MILRAGFVFRELAFLPHSLGVVRQLGSMGRIRRAEVASMRPKFNNDHDLPPNKHTTPAATKIKPFGSGTAAAAAALPKFADNTRKSGNPMPPSRSTLPSV